MSRNVGNMASRNPRASSPPPPTTTLSPSSSCSSSSSFCCEVCLEDLPLSLLLPSSLHQCRCPDRLICCPCTASYIEVAVRAGSSWISCPLWCRDCPTALDPIRCRKLVSEEVFNKWCRLACEENLLGCSRCYCPNRDCQELIIDECCQSVAPRRIVCPACNKRCCFRCSLPWDEQQRHKCDQVISVVERKKWMSCPGCKNYVERIDGCRSVFCRCGTVFCYNCGTADTMMHSCSTEKIRQKFMIVKESLKSMGERLKDFSLLCRAD